MRIRRLLAISVGAVLTIVCIRFAVAKLSVFGTIAGHTEPLKEPIPAYTRALHPNYPYSVIPGGAYSAAELRYADREDQVVKEHYADFDLKNAHMEQLTADRFQYVSYRIKKKVYWTKKKLRIPKGEVLLTDGQSWARARCGNRLSSKPHKQVSNLEPPAKLLSMPPMQLGAPMELAEAPPLGDISEQFPLLNLPKVTPPILPSGATTDNPPPDFPPLNPVIPVVPVPPGGIFPPIGPPGNPTSPPVTPPANPPVIPPGNPPNVSTVPEPNGLYLFFVTFVLSLYGLTRMVTPEEKGEAKKPEGSGEE